LRKLFDRFDRIAESPRAFPAIDDIRQGYRRCIAGPDSIYFRIKDGVVDIVSILGRQDVMVWLER